MVQWKECSRCIYTIIIFLFFFFNVVVEVLFVCLVRNRILILLALLGK